MKILKKAGHPQPTKLQKRISGLPTSEIIIWTENYLAQIGKNVAGLGEKTPAHYSDALQAAEVVVDLVSELHKRSNV
jgi:hypothetical protein